MHVFTFFLKVEFHWISPMDCTVGLHYTGPPGESWRGYLGRVLSVLYENGIMHFICTGET